MATAPKCKICGAAHWSREPHKFERGSDERRPVRQGDIGARVRPSEGREAVGALAPEAGHPTGQDRQPREIPVGERTPPVVRRPGRPKLEDRGKTIAAQKPWLHCDPPMSERSWYRRGKPMPLKAEKEQAK